MTSLLPCRTNAGRAAGPAARGTAAQPATGTYADVLAAVRLDPASRQRVDGPGPGPLAKPETGPTSGPTLHNARDAATGPALTRVLRSSPASPPVPHRGDGLRGARATAAQDEAMAMQWEQELADLTAGAPPDVYGSLGTGCAHTAVAHQQRAPTGSSSAAPVPHSPTPNAVPAPTARPDRHALLTPNPSLNQIQDPSLYRPCVRAPEPAHAVSKTQPQTKSIPVLDTALSASPVPDPRQTSAVVSPHAAKHNDAGRMIATSLLGPNHRSAAGAQAAAILVPNPRPGERGPLGPHSAGESRCGETTAAAPTVTSLLPAPRVGPATAGALTAERPPTAASLLRGQDQLRGGARPRPDRSPESNHRLIPNPNLTLNRSPDTNAGQPPHVHPNLDPGAPSNRNPKFGCAGANLNHQFAPAPSTGSVHVASSSSATTIHPAVPSMGPLRRAPASAPMQAAMGTGMATEAEEARVDSGFVTGSGQKALRVSRQAYERAAAAAAQVLLSACH